CKPTGGRREREVRSTQLAGHAAEAPCLTNYSYCSVFVLLRAVSSNPPPTLASSPGRPDRSRQLATGGFSHTIARSATTARYRESELRTVPCLRTGSCKFRPAFSGICAQSSLRQQCQRIARRALHADLEVQHRRAL